MSIKDNAITIKSNRGEWTVFPGLCKGCGLCIEKCPTATLDWCDTLGIYGTPIPNVKDSILCTSCKKCQLSCPDCAISVEIIPTQAS